MTAHNYWFEAVGLLGACLTTFSFLPQAFRIWRSRSARDVSLVMYLMMTTGSAIWLIYGLLLGSPALILSNAVGFVLVGSVLALKLQEYRHPSYPQGAGEFVAGLSIIDALMHCGVDGVRKLVRG